MPSNIEIKACAKNFLYTKQIAERLSDTAVGIIQQQGIFFHCTHGRLKLRILSDESGKIMHSFRRSSSECSSPRRGSELNHLIAKTSNPRSLQNTLTSALGIPGVVRKVRHLYLVGQTRVHPDEVGDPVNTWNWKW